MANKSSKGSAFERQMCKQLSLWWSKGERDDLYWRTCQSGGRATSRGKSNKTTAGQYGDITCTDPDGIGSELTRVFTLELKNGYGRWSFLDIMVAGITSKRHPFVLFWEQVSRDCSSAGNYPLLLVRRHACVPMVVIERNVCRCVTKTTKMPHPVICFKNDTYDVAAMPLDVFLDYLDRGKVIQMAGYLEEDRK